MSQGVAAINATRLKTIKPRARIESSLPVKMEVINKTASYRFVSMIILSLPKTESSAYHWKVEDSMEVHISKMVRDGGG